MGAPPPSQTTFRELKINITQLVMASKVALYRAMLPYTMPTISGHWPMSDWPTLFNLELVVLLDKDTLWTAAAIIPVGEPVAAKVLALKNKHNVDSRVFELDWSTGYS